MRTLALVLMLLQDHADRVASLARDLESADVRKSHAALRAIVAEGEPALPAVEALARASKGRARDYLEVAANEIRTASVGPAVRRMSIQSSGRTVVQVLTDFRERSGAAFPLENLLEEERPPLIEVQVRDATMMEAFEAICRAGNVSLVMEGGHFALYPGSYVDMPRFFYGHYQFQLQHFRMQRTVTFRKPAAHVLTLSMGLMWDPVAAPARLDPLRILEAVDDKGKDLVRPPEVNVEPPDPPPARPQELEVVLAEPVPPGHEARDTITLHPLSAGAEKIAVLRGILPVQAAKKSVAVTIDRPAEGMRKEHAGFEIAVTGIDAEQHHLELKVTSKTMKPAALARLPVLAGVIVKGGERLRTSIIVEVEEDGVRLGVGFQPRLVVETQVPPPAVAIDRIEVVFVTETAEKLIPFEFRDVKFR